MALPTVLVLGDEGVGKTSLIKALAGEEGAVWRLDTKYYTASATLIAQQLEACVPAGGIALEALVLMVDASKHSSYLKLRRWWESARAADLGHWQVGLVVVNKVDLVEGSQPEWVMEVQEWAVEEMLECVEASAGNEVADSLLGDQGVARIRAALEAHIWPGMKLKQRKLGAQSSTSVPEEVAVEGPEGSEHHAVMGCPEAFNVDNRLLDFGKDGERAQPRQDVDSWVLFTSESDRESAGNEGNALDGPFSVPTDDLEVLGDNFEKLMLDIVGAREKLQHLSDDDRREGAAQLAMKIASMIDRDESGSLDSPIAEP